MCNLSTRTSVTYVPGLYTPQGEGVSGLSAWALPSKREPSACRRGFSTARGSLSVCQVQVYKVAQEVGTG